MGDELIDRRLGQYLITEVIAYGGMATVYKATQPSLDRVVAIKVLRHDADPQFAARFKREARATAALQHHNILPIYDNNEQDGLLYLVLQYVEDGRTLGGMLGMPMAPVAALRLMSHVFDALDYAHKRGIVHRDIKPSNILMPMPNWPMVTDFGIAKLLNDAQMQLTRSNQRMGTPAYMAPEQVTGRPIDARTDLYSAGVVLYELVTGSVPFEADTIAAMMNKHVNEAPPPPRRLNPEIPAALETLLLRALAKDPNQRYQTIAEMAAEMERVTHQLDLNRERGQITSLYEGGVQAFEQGHWDEAVERLDKLNALAPNYEDAADLLEAARAAQERAKTEARQQIEQMRQRRLSTIQQIRPPAAPVPPESMPAPDVLATPTRRRVIRWAPIFAAMVVLVVALLGIIWLRRSVSLTPAVTGGVASADPQAATSVLERSTSAPLPTVAPVNTPASAAAPTASASMGMSGDAPTSGVAPATAEAGGHDMQGGPTAMAGGEQPETDSLPTPAGTLVYEDDFDADASVEISRTGLEDVKGDAEFNPGFHPGVYRMEIAKANETHAILLPRLAFSNFSMRMDLSDDSDTPDGDVAQGVVFRAQDDTHFYTVLIDPRKGQYAIRKLNGADTWSDLIAWTPSPIVKRKGDTNRLRVDALGTTFTIYLNGQSLGQIADTDRPLPFGLVGMIVSNIDGVAPTLHFDNLKIWSNDPVGSAPAPDPKRAMIRIPAGPFILGSYLFGNQKPQIVALADFLIDRTEVTNAAYKQCVDAKKCESQTPGSDSHPNYANDPLYVNFPATHISWRQARDFCAWAGKRLPTEAEWEKAASWNTATQEKFDWPWGNAFDPARLNSVESNHGDTTAVGTFQPELNGTVDMAGNVSEWTSSLSMPYPYDPKDGRENLQAEGKRVYRGGSYLQSKGKARGFFRRDAPATDPNREIGFRCAATP